MTLHLLIKYQWKNSSQPTTLQYATFYNAKGHLLHYKRPSFTMRKTAFYNTLIINTLRNQRKTATFKGLKQNWKTPKIFWKTFGRLKYNAYLCTRIWEIIFANALVAQLVEHLTLNQRVQGSNPCRRTKEISKRFKSKRLPCGNLFVFGLQQALPVRKFHTATGCIKTYCCVLHTWIP